MTNGLEVDLTLVLNLPERQVADIWMVIAIANSSQDINHGRMLFLMSSDLDSSPAAGDRSTWLMLTAANPYLMFNPHPWSVAGSIRTRAQNFTGQTLNPALDIFYTRRKVGPIEWAELRLRLSQGG